MFEFPPIAIVGMGCVVPGAADVETFWRNIISGHDQSREVPPGRWVFSPERVAGESPGTDTVQTNRGCFVDDFELDPRGLALDTALLKRLDLVYQFALHAGRAAMEDGVTEGLDRSRAGVILAAIALPTDGASTITREILGDRIESELFGTTEHAQKARSTDDAATLLNGRVTALPATLLSRALSLGGSSYTLDAACASSLYAVKLACDELNEGRADAMLAGGVSRPDCLYTQMGFTQLRALSTSGRCSPFDAQSDGLLVGEGAGVVLLKRLSDALRDGDRVYGVIRGIGLSNDIGGSLLAPDSEGQLRALRAAYKQAGWSPCDVELLECHGTGTPLGDAVEIRSLRALWGDNAIDARRCAIGSVKSMVGHLLTAAGAAGLIKTLLALHHHVLPPSANFMKPSEMIPLEGSPFRVQQSAETWMQQVKGTPRRAGVNAFGFGGINAHVLLEEFDPVTQTTRPTHKVIEPAGLSSMRNSEPIAIVGMGARFGDIESLDALCRRILRGQTFHTTRGSKRWYGIEGNRDADTLLSYGAYLSELKIPIGKYRLPPAEIPSILPQQLVMLETVAEALQDAGLPLRARRPSSGVVIGITNDFETTNYHLRWWIASQGLHWARKLGLAEYGPEFDRWLTGLRDGICPALDAPRVLGALGGIVASRIAREFEFGGPSFTVSAEEASGLVAMEIAVRALQRGEVDLAVAGAVDMAGDIRNVRSVNAMQVTLEAGRKETVSTPIGEGAAAIVLKRLSDARRDGDKVYAIIEEIGTGRYSSDNHDQGIVSRGISDVRSIVGWAGAATGMATIIKAATCLHHRVLPTDNISEVTVESKRIACQAWLRPGDTLPRRASIVVETGYDHINSVIMREADAVTPAMTAGIIARQVFDRPAVILVIEANDVRSLLERMNELEHAVKDHHNHLELLAVDWNSKHRQPGASRAIAFVATEIEKFRRNLIEARNQLRTDVGKTISGLPGVYYSPTPLGKDGSLAFVYPGSGNHFVGIGRELALCFPGVLEDLQKECAALHRHLMPEIFWSDADPEMKAKAVSQLTEDPRRAIFGQVSYGVMASDVLQSLGVSPDAMIGYSLGESAALFASRAWPDREEMYRRMFSSPLFLTELNGPRNAVRRAWKIPDGEPVDWIAVLVPKPVEAVREALQGLTCARLLIVNTPKECVVGGLKHAVDTLVSRLRCRAVALEGVPAVHCDVVEAVRDAYHAMHVMRTVAPKGITLYSAHLAAPYRPTTDTAADAILNHALHGFDYSAVIERAYADAVRMFVEVGPQGSCTRMIGRILAGRPHLARTLSVKGESEWLSLLNVLAALIAERVPVDISALNPSKHCFAAVSNCDTYQAAVTVKVGGSFHIPKTATTNLATGHEKMGVPSARFVPPAVVTSGKSTASALLEATASTAGAHRAFLSFSQAAVQGLTAALDWQARLMREAEIQGETFTSGGNDEAPTVSRGSVMVRMNPPAYSREQCIEFARGRVANVLGPEFSAIDTYPVRVRLPDEPLMLVDRILTVEGEKGALGPGRLVTEHDVAAGAWYLDCGRCPICVTVEAGQADLFLSSYLGIDFVCKGTRAYRLLDATVTFHRGLPRPGETIRYDIRILRFVRQGETYLFFFEFDGTIGDELVITMRDGCAGFFTREEIQASHGIILTDQDRKSPRVNRQEVDPDWPIAAISGARVGSVENYSDQQVSAFRHGDLSGCFGDDFTGLSLIKPIGLPGGRMKLIDRVLELQPNGGPHGLGRIVAEADVNPDDWFLMCHFVDDMVMPGTLMYECTVHALRFLLARLGWVGECGEMAYEPVMGVHSALKCRGPVTPTTKKATYQVEITEVGYRPEPYVLADALMYADDKPIVRMTNMSLQLTGMTRDRLDEIWRNRSSPLSTRRKPLFTYEQIRAFAVSHPSDCFGERYRVFDDGPRRCARLPGPPYQFLDCVVVADHEPFNLTPGGWVEAEYVVPQDAWYFAANRQPTMPFCVLLEIALQPCGFLAAYAGSALHSEVNLSFRNLGGEAVQHQEVFPNAGTLRTRVRMTSVSRAGGMIIEKFDMQMLSGDAIVYDGNTSFGFFSAEALAKQVGVRDASQWLWNPSEHNHNKALRFRLPDAPPHTPLDMAQSPWLSPIGLLLPGRALRMIDEIVCLLLDGGPSGLGHVHGGITVDPDAWFFKAHFYQDPVWPGSLGLEAFLQLLKVYAIERWPELAESHRFETISVGVKHSWIYRGQVLPSNHRVEVQAMIKRRDEGAEPMVVADGFLSVDGVIIYEMRDFGLRLVRAGRRV